MEGYDKHSFYSTATGDMDPLTDNCCTRMQWREYQLGDGQLGYDFHLSVHPDTDLTQVIRAFDHDEQEMLIVNGRDFDTDEWTLLNGEELAK